MRNTMIYLAILSGVIGLVTFVGGPIYKVESYRNGYIDPKKKALKGFFTWSGVVLLGVMVVIFLFSSIAVVQPGYVGVKILFRKIQKDTFTKGLHFKNPFVSVKRMSTKTQS